jgi:glycosyltransferase involved in cell wall biosynthesis
VKVGMLTQSVSRQAGGTFEALRSLSAALHHPPGIEIRVFGLEDEATAADRDAWRPVPIDVSTVRGPRSFGYSPHLASRLGSAAVDILHVHGLWMFTSIAARLWSVRTRAPYLISPHGMLDPWALKHSRWKKRIVSALYELDHLRRATCLHALCDAELEAIRAFGLRNPVCVIPNGVAAVDRRTSHRAQWRSDMPENANVLLYLGRLHPKKGLESLLLAWSELHSSGDKAALNWYLVIAGWDQGSHRTTLEAIALRRGIRDRVRFVGPQFGMEKDATFLSSDAFILPSLSEGMPMTVLEAWAYGLPVLMTPQCNLPEGFARGAALPVDPNREGIARQLKALFAMSDDCRRQLGARGLNLVRTRFNWAIIADQLESVYRWVFGVGPQPACVHLA